VYVPSFKVGFHPGKLTWNQTTKRSNNHVGPWQKEAGEKLAPQVAKRAEAVGKKNPPLYLQWNGGPKPFLTFGTAEDIASLLSRLPWDSKGSGHSYQIDHKQELQLGGNETDAAANMWLLDSSLNQSSGPTIDGGIRSDLNAFLDVARPYLQVAPSSDSTLAKLGYTVTFGEARAGPPTHRASKSKAFAKGAYDKATDSWSLDDLGKPTAVAPLVKMSAENRKKVGGSPDELVIYGARGGGVPRRVPYRKGTVDTSKWFGRGYKVVSATYTEGDHQPGAQVGQFTLRVYENHKVLKGSTFTLPVIAMSGVDYGGLLDQSKLYEQRTKLIEAKAFSPIDLGQLEFDLDRGLVARGNIPKPTLKLLERVDIALVLTGDDVALQATIAGGDLSVPGPFKIKGGVLTLTGGSGGLSVDGQIDFEIEKLAKGWIKGSAGTKGGGEFSLAGSLDFDTKMFTQAHLGLSYADGKWGAEGKLAVGPDKIKGIKSASASVTVDDDKVDASGEFESSIKGVEKGKVGFKYDPAEGMAITGEITLGKLPGLKGGKLAATVKEGKEGWTLSGGVTIQPDVPGVDGDVTGTYDDGAFLVEANLSYAKGMAKGSVRVGLTNQEVGPDNKPTGPPKDTLLVYGGGEVTLTITPWLQGTVGLQLKRDGSIEVKGKVALPDHFDVFPEKKVEKRIFSIGIDIPIIGVSVAGQRIGIFATIKGGMDIEAGFGPGQLRDLGLEVVYNPDHEDDTRVTGTATFAIPAHAGLKLFVDGGIGAGIPVVSATAGVEIFGELGLAGLASASTTVEWSPGRGVVLDAKGELMVEPKFKFGIDAFVDVSADLLIHTIELYHHVWHLAAFEYGSGLRFGMTFPIHYEEGKPFDLSFDQVQWTYPHIDAGELLGGLVKQLID